MKVEDIKLGQVLRMNPDNGWRGVVIPLSPRPEDPTPRYATVSIQVAGGKVACHTFGCIREGLIFDLEQFEVDDEWLAQK